ncbi:MAG: Spy/CpxP family protein refolding chaperone [Bryobacteraceae bacterium]
MRSLGLVFLLATLPAAAQHIPGSSWAWWTSPVVRDMNLSQEQLQRIHTTVREYRPRLIDLRGAVQKAELDVEDAFNDENFDARRATAAVDHLLEARGDLGKALAQLSLRLRAALTADQWRDLQRRKPRNEK